MKHEAFKNFLSRYLEGALSEKEKGSFELHNADCPRCAEEIHHLIDARELIDGYALRKLSVHEEEFLERHYFSCPSCLEAVQQAEAMVAGARLAAQVVPESSWLERVQSFFAQFQFPISAPVYVLAAFVLLLVYPAWRGMFELPRVERDLARLARPQVNGLVHMLLATREVEQRIIIPRPNSVAIPVVLQFTLTERAEKNSKLRAEILAFDDNAIIWRAENLLPFGEYEIFAIACPSSFFHSGRFLLKVYEVNAANENVLPPAEFPFEIAFAE